MKSIFYYTNWSCYERNYQITDIPTSVKNVAYAFFNVASNGTVFSGDQWADDKNLGALQSIRPNFKTSLAIGGWTWSKNFSLAVATATCRKLFISSLADILTKCPVFSGIIIDWEYLSEDGINHGLAGNISSKADLANFVLLLQELRIAQPTMTIGVCCSSTPYFNISDVNPYVDEFHLMTYDSADGSWGNITQHQTNPRKSSFSNFSCEDVAKLYISKVPASKLFIGGVTYCRGFAQTNGLGKSANGSSPDSETEYRKLPLAGATEYFDEEAKACYSYDPVKQIFNSYDNVASITEKYKIISELGLGGLIVWDMAGDADGSRSISGITSKIIEIDMSKYSSVRIVRK